MNSNITWDAEGWLNSNNCLDVAREWVNDGLEVSVLNIASRGYALADSVRHVDMIAAAELFTDVLHEEEFAGAFCRICFAVKSGHNSIGDSNYLAFKKVFQNFQR